MKIRKILSFLCLIHLAATGFAQERIMLDGILTEWDHRPFTMRDETGDGVGGGLDFLDLTMTHDSSYLFLRIRLSAEVSLQNQSGMILAIDADNNPATGQSIAGLGAELVWRFGEKKGTAQAKGSPVNVTHAIGVFALPSWSSTEFEVAVSRTASVSGTRLFQGDKVRITFWDDRSSGDRIPNTGSVEYDCSGPGETPPPTSTTDRLLGTDLRLLTWNTLQEGLTDTKRIPAFSRVLKALAPDVMCFQECFSTTAAKAQATVQASFSAPPGRTWKSYKLDAGNVLVTWLNVDRSWPILDRYRESAFLLSMDGNPVMLVINVHFRCCEADAERQKEVDAVVSFLRDAREPGGLVTVPSNLPIFIVGDYNFVGQGRQMTTLTTGDIVDNATFGPDSPPGWNNTNFQILPPRHLRGSIHYTWYDVTGSYLAAVLDQVMFTMPEGQFGNHFVFNSEDLSPEEATRLGVLANDTHTTSDHLPRVVDVRPASVNATDPSHLPFAPALLDLYPQPCASEVTVNMMAPSPGEVEYSCMDLNGRLVHAGRTSILAPGPSAITLRLPDSAPSLLFLMVRIHGTTFSRMLVRTRK